jgi:tRNA threonylcarbamoyladenosine biosynthesis protein TsaE
MLIRSVDEMFELGSKLAKKNKILLLNWPLWAGKTLLTKWFASWLSIDPDIVQSPTYTYINIYDDKLLHIDMYRLQEYDDLVQKWILDQIHQYEYIVIERPKFVDQIWFRNYLQIDIDKKSQNQRIVSLLDK